MNFISAVTRRFGYKLRRSCRISAGRPDVARTGYHRGSWDINPSVAYFYGNPYEDQQQAIGQRLTAFDKAQDGSETKLFSYDFTRGTTSTTTSLGSGKSLSATLDYDIGYSYVSMGEWDWYFVHLDGGTVGGFSELLFVTGDRTPASGIPVSGKATYDAHTLSLLSTDLKAGHSVHAHGRFRPADDLDAKSNRIIGTIRKAISWTTRLRASMSAEARHSATAAHSISH